MPRAWDKEKIWSPCQDLNLLPPEHQAGALSTNLDSVSLSFIESKAKYSNSHQISLKHYTETEGFFVASILNQFIQPFLVCTSLLRQ